MEMIILIGLPGSGKSSFYSKHFANSHTHISKDKMLNANQPGKRQMVLIQEALERGDSVVIDNTNPVLKDRQVLIEAAGKAGARVVGYYFDVPVAKCLLRNEQRSGKARVPKVAIFTSAKRMVHPHREEGFDELYRVTFENRNGTEVEVVEPL